MLILDPQVVDEHIYNLVDQLPLVLLYFDLRVSVPQPMLLPPPLPEHHIDLYLLCLDYVHDVQHHGLLFGVVNEHLFYLRRGRLVRVVFGSQYFFRNLYVLLLLEHVAFRLGFVLEVEPRVKLAVSVFLKCVVLKKLLKPMVY